MNYTVQRDDAPRENFGDYRYRIYRDGHLVAYYWHDFRGDEHGIEFVNGPNVHWPVGRMVDFLKGGGRNPTTLSSGAEAFMEERLPTNWITDNSPSMNIDATPSDPRPPSTAKAPMPGWLKLMTGHALFCVLLIPLALIPRPDLPGSPEFMAWKNAQGPLVTAALGLVLTTAGVLFLLRRGFGRYLYVGVFAGVMVGFRLYLGQLVAAAAGAIVVGFLASYLFRNEGIRAYFDR